MAGKSTYIRQVALLTLLAHTGSFVPAAEARIDLVDRIFTRIGASDDLARGQSTFMVEMTETANILNNATARSLIVLDEIGRGTSTFDGLSLAWSIVEHLHNQVGAKTLFATHYHELTELAARLPRIEKFQRRRARVARPDCFSPQNRRGRHGQKLRHPGRAAGGRAEGSFGTREANSWRTSRNPNSRRKAMCVRNTRQQDATNCKISPRRRRWICLENKCMNIGIRRPDDGQGWFAAGENPHALEHGGNLSARRARHRLPEKRRTAAALSEPEKPVRANRTIRGGVPICFPWFGNRDGEPSHGFARIAEWQLVKTSVAPDGSGDVDVCAAGNSRTRRLETSAHGISS